MIRIGRSPGSVKATPDVEPIRRTGKSQLRLSLAAYSYNRHLSLRGKKKPTTPSSSTTSSTGAPATSVATVPAGIAPLTGLPGDAAKLHRPALIVKIDNAPTARPQAGLNQADIVYEEGVEGGVTRFATIFHSQRTGLAPIVFFVAPLFAAIPVGLLLSNFIVWCIPPYRRAIEPEAKGVWHASFSDAQKDLSVLALCIGGPAILASFVAALVMR